MSEKSAMEQQAELSITAHKAWLAILSLSFAAFIFNTTEFVPIGLLPDIASSFNLNIAHTGLIITGYAWVVALASLPLTVLVANVERHKLLIVLFILFIAANALAAFAWNFSVLVIARMIIACTHAIFWSITTPLAVRLAPAGKRNKALGLLVTGSSIAIVLGVPIGTIIGNSIGWRMAFLTITIAALLILIILVYLLPPVPSNNTVRFKNLPQLFKRPALLNFYLLVAVIITGHFVAYTYLSPFMQQQGGFSADFVVLLLLVIGCAGVVASLLYARYLSRYSQASFVLPAALLLCCLLLLSLSSQSRVTALLLGFGWGLAITSLSLALQAKVLELASDAQDIANSVYSGIYNLGIGSGALIGGQVVLLTSIGDVGYFGSLFILGALCLFYGVTRHYWFAYSSVKQSRIRRG